MSTPIRISPADYGFSRRPTGNVSQIEADDTRQHLSMLMILHAATATAVEHFRAAANPVDRELVQDLEKMVERTRVEIDRLAAILSRPS